MTVEYNDSITYLPIARIHVLNPRNRGRNKFQEIVTNIHEIGLKKPITVVVSGSREGETHYNLVCGQGRLEAYSILGQEEIPCIIVDANKEDAMLMSLVENVARRQHSCIDMIRQLGLLKENGYTFSEIAKKIGMDAGYVKGLLKLLDKGEERLLHAVEKGLLPVSTAVMIATSNDEDLQIALQEAYDKNELRGDALVKVRRISEERRRKGKSLHNSELNSKQKRPTTKDLVQSYENELIRQQSLVNKSKAFESKLLMAISAFSEVFQSSEFRALLKAESLSSIPQYLADRVTIGAQS